jgi:predicted transcriptional regulator
MIRFLRRRGAHRNPAGSPDLGPLENTVMEILWEGGEWNVHQVTQRIERPLAYTTVMTTLDRLYKKGLLDRRKSERAYFYSPRMTHEQWERQVAAEFVAGYLAGPRPAGELLISCLVDAVGQRNEALLDALEKKIRMKRKELDRRRKS